MAQFVLKIEKLSHIIDARESRDLRSPFPIMAPGPKQYDFQSIEANVLEVIKSRKLQHIRRSYKHEAFN